MSCPDRDENQFLDIGLTTAMRINQLQFVSSNPFEKRNNYFANPYLLWITKLLFPV